MKISEATGLGQFQVTEVVQTMLDIIAKEIAAGGKVELRNFGVFGIRVRKARIGRNPKSPAANVAIPARAVVKFKPGKELRMEVFKLAGESRSEVSKNGG